MWLDTEFWWFLKFLFNHKKIPIWIWHILSFYHSRWVGSLWFFGRLKPWNNWQKFRISGFVHSSTLKRRKSFDHPLIHNGTELVCGAHRNVVHETVEYKVFLSERHMEKANRLIEDEYIKQYEEKHHMKPFPQANHWYGDQPNKCCYCCQNLGNEKYIGGNAFCVRLQTPILKKFFNIKSKPQYTIVTKSEWNRDKHRSTMEGNYENNYCCPDPVKFRH